jgi:hypothetical protein
MAKKTLCGEFSSLDTIQCAITGAWPYIPLVRDVSPIVDS